MRASCRTASHSTSGRTAHPHSEAERLSSAATCTQQLSVVSSFCNTGGFLKELGREQTAMSIGRAAFLPRESSSPAQPPVHGNFPAQQTFTMLLGSTVCSIAECEQAAIDRRQSSFAVCKLRLETWCSPGESTSHASLLRAPHPLWSSRQLPWTPAAAFDSHASDAHISDLLPL